MFVWCLTDRKGRGGGGGGGGHQPCRKAGEGAYVCGGRGREGEQQYAEMKGAGNRIELH